MGRVPGLWAERPSVEAAGEALESPRGPVGFSARPRSRSRGGGPQPVPAYFLEKGPPCIHRGAEHEN